MALTSADAKPASQEPIGELGRLVEDLDDPELAPVGQATPDDLGRRRPRGARRAGRQSRAGWSIAPELGSGRESTKAKVPPGLSQRRTRARNPGRPGARDVAQPEPAEDRVHLAVRLGPGVADVEVGPQPMGQQALAGEVEWRLGRVVAGEAALRGEERRPPAGAGGQLHDLAGEREPVEPQGGLVELRVPGLIVDRAVGVPTAAEVPVVVLAGPGLVVGDHLRRRARPRPPSSAAARPRPRSRPVGRPAARPRSSRAVLSRNRRKPLSPARPTQSGQSWAQPSRSSGPRVVQRVPHHRQSNAARYGIGSAPGPRGAGSSWPAARSRRTRRDRRSRPAARSRR